MASDVEQPQRTTAGPASGATRKERSVPPPGPPGRLDAARRALRRNTPGLALAATGVALAEGVHALLPGIPMLTAAVALGIVAAHLPGSRTWVRNRGRVGLSMAGKRLMRAGVVLLGLKLSIGDVLGLGWATVAMVLGVVVATFFGTLWLGRRLGLSGDQPLLVATGYAICGASAIGAVSSVLGREEHDRSHSAQQHGKPGRTAAAAGATDHSADVATSVALVTLCGTLAIAVLPLLKHPLGLDAVQFGRWVGAGVHDVGQVVATAQTAGPTALGDAVLVKLMRVAMLAPLVAGVSLVERRRRARAGGDLAAAPARGRRPAVVPLFVVAFLLMVGLRSTGWLPDGLLNAADLVQEILLAAALVGLGSAVHLPTLVRSGARMAALGLGAWIVVAGASYAGVVLTT
ncbi:YeiH family protein [Streptomyces sp. NPDC001292]|uniref:YeiH family protein n=1 Tax=Streptomyces sp. NPDC001292 TaxID=3364558 RepID=UPI00367AEAFA